MKLKVPQNLGNIDNLTDLIKYVTVTFDQVVSVINGRISVTDNIEQSLVTATFGVANQEVQVSHGLSRLPVGWLVVTPSVAMSVYAGTTTNTDKNVYVKSSAIGNCQLLIF